MYDFHWCPKCEAHIIMGPCYDNMGVNAHWECGSKTYGCPGKGFKASIECRLRVVEQKLKEREENKNESI